MDVNKFDRGFKTRCCSIGADMSVDVNRSGGVYNEMLLH